MQIEPLSKHHSIWKKPRSQIFTFGKVENFSILFRWIYEQEVVLGFGAIVPKRVERSSVLRHKVKRRLRHCFFLVHSYIFVPITVLCITRNSNVLDTKFSDLLNFFEQFAIHIESHRDTVGLIRNAL